MFHTSLPTKTLQDNNTQTEDKASNTQSVPPIIMFQPTRFSRFQVLPPVLCTRRLYIHVIVLLFVGLLVLLLRTIASMRLAFVHYHLESDTDGELVILPEEFTQSKGAFCLDGSPPAYYYRQSKRNPKFHCEFQDKNSFRIVVNYLSWLCIFFMGLEIKEGR